MAHRRVTDAVDPYDIRIQRLLSGASEQVRAPFLSMMRTGAI